MKIDIIAKALIVNLVVLYPLSSLGWTVSDTVVELSHNRQSREQRPISTRAIKLAPPVNLSEKMSEIRMDKESDNIALNESKAFFEKTEAVLDPDEQGCLDYQQALKYVSRGEIIQAKQMLFRILDRFPRHQAARKELANLYLKDNELQEAEDLLLVGLNLDEINPDFLRLLAVVYDKKNEPERALSLLVKVKDSRKRDKNYIALLGHLYQQTGRYTLARQQYYHLFQMEPKNSLWLLGLSIALDAEGQKAAALEGYRALISKEDIDPNIFEYIQNRIQILKG